jgi:hypothetical protein
VHAGFLSCGGKGHYLVIEQFFLEPEVYELLEAFHLKVSRVVYTSRAVVHGGGFLPMNWDIASTLAEIVAAVGVIFSLLYLATQIRGSSNTENARAFESAINSFHQATGNLLDTENLELFLKGLENYESLNDGKKLRFHVLVVRLIDRFEIMLQFERLNITGKGHLTGMFGPIMRDWLNYPGFRAVWDGESPYFSINLRQWHQENIEGKELSATGYVGQIISDDSASTAD